MKKTFCFLIAFLISTSSAFAGKSVIDRNAVFKRVPNGVKLRGVNIGGLGPTFEADYANWSTRWLTVVKPMIAKAKADGMNVIRMQGDIGGIFDGAYTRAQFLSHVDDVIQYAQELGLYFYATASRADNLGTATHAQVQDEIVAYVQNVVQYPNVIAIDLMNEIHFLGLSQADTWAYIHPITAAVRAAGTNGVPITYSLDIWLPLSVNWIGYMDSSIVDFLDLHNYSVDPDVATVQIISDALNTYNASNQKFIVLGECCAIDNSIKVQRTQQSQDIAQMPNVAGVIIWALSSPNGVYVTPPDPPTWTINTPDITGIYKTNPNSDLDTRIPIIPKADTTINSTTYADVSGAYFSFDNDFACVATINSDFDFDAGAGNWTLTATLDGTPIANPKTLVYSGSVHSTISFAQTVSISSTGRHTIKLQAKLTSGSGTAYVRGANTKALIQLRPTGNFVLNGGVHASTIH